MGGPFETSLGKGRWVVSSKNAALGGGIFRSRSDESYSQKWNYVRENPVRAGLVKSVEDWPYQGEIVHIDRA